MPNPNDAIAVLLRLQAQDRPSATGPYAPGTGTNRNNARAAVLAKFLGIPDDGSISQSDLEQTYQGLQGEQDAAEARKAAAALGPEQTRGEYALAGERIKAQSAVEAARAAAEHAATERETQREFQAQQGQLNREAITQRQATTSAGVEQRRAATRESIARGQTQAQNEARAKRLLSPEASMGHEDAPRPANESFLSRWLYGPGQSTLNQQEAARLRAQSPASAGRAGDDVVGAYAQTYAGLSGEALLSALQHDPGLSDASPDEILGLAQEIESR